MELSEKEYIVEKFILGICYHFGIETNINKEKVFRVYNYLAKKGYDKV